LIASNPTRIGSILLKLRLPEVVRPFGHAELAKKVSPKVGVVSLTAAGASLRRCFDDSLLQPTKRIFSAYPHPNRTPPALSDNVHTRPRTVEIIQVQKFSRNCDGVPFSSNRQVFFKRQLGAKLSAFVRSVTGYYY
jgi:hypothetical protein